MPVQALQCKECDATYPLDARYVCEQCFGPLEVAYDHSGIDPAEAKRKIQAGPQTIWRYADFLPFAGQPAAGLPVGLTPLQRAPRLAEALGVGEVLVKNDTANPTHSFKDRVVAVALAKARELGYEVVACASTGNLANAVAAHAAAAGLESYVFVPADLEEQKILATGGYEIAEQLGFELPDRVVAPVASGSLFTKIARGFEEWIEVGLLDGETPAFN